MQINLNLSPQQAVIAFYPQWVKGNEKKKVEVSLVLLTTFKFLLGGNNCITKVSKGILTGLFFDKADFVAYAIEVYKELQLVKELEAKSIVDMIVERMKE